MNRKIVIVSVFFIFLSIVFGAFGAHGMKSITDELKALNAFEVGAKYLTYSGLGLFILSLNHDKFNFSLKWVYTTIIVGTIIFSGFLFLYSIHSIIPALKIFARFVPIGGLLMITGWGLLGLKLLKK
jgi:uncharacterized membrane protein YgdD (TMEM256/DUF423 family)